MNLKEIPLESLQFNPFVKIGKEWMLISAADETRSDKKINTMTASWGGVGVLWGKNVFFCFIRPQRFTKEFADASYTVTLSFFDEEYRDALTFCGRVSGRNCDKIAEAGLSASLSNGAVIFDQARLTVVGKKLYAGYIDKNAFIDKSIIPACYKDEDYHMMYICEITKIYG